ATTSVTALDLKRQALRLRSGQASSDARVNVEFWGGVVPGNAPELEPLIDAGVRGFKCFLVPSGVDEFPAVTEDDLRKALPILARRNVPLLAHAELAFAAGPPSNADYASYLLSRPPGMELEAVRLLIRLAE